MKRKDVLLLLIPSFIFVVAWTGFSIYHSFVNSTISEVQNVQIFSISPNFDTNTINALKKRQNVSPIYDLNSSLITNNTGQASTSASATPTPTPILTPTPVSSGNTQQSTPGGILSQ